MLGYLLLVYFTASCLAQGFPGKGPCAGHEFGDLIPDTTDCSYYYQCMSATTVRRPCPSGLHFSAKLKLCDFPLEAKCEFSGGTGSTTTSPNTVPTPGSTTGSNPPSTQTASIPPTTQSTTVSSAPPPISGEGPCAGHEYGDLIPDPTNCSWFYQCVTATTVRILCPSGLHFSAALKRCEYPSVANCTVDGGTGSTTTPSITASTPPSIPTASTPSTTLPTTESIGPPITGEGPCAGHQYGDLIPDPTNCSWYYHCVSADAARRPCPSGLHFSAALKRCEYPSVANCTVGGGTGSTTTPSITASTPPSIPTASTPSTTQPTTVSSAPPPISGEGPCAGHEYGDLIPDPTNCSWFYQCVTATTVRMQCPSGLHFSVTLKRCEYPSVANCTVGGGTGSTTTPSITASTPPSIPTASTPPTTQPTTESSGPPISGEGPCAGHQYGDLIPDPTNCSWYYHCVSADAARRPCPSGLHFSATLKRCEYPSVANCTVGGGTGSTTTPSVTASTPPSIPTAPTPSTTQPTTVSSAPPPISGEGPCAGHEYGDLIPDPTNCSWFYQCVTATTVRMPCPSGLHFSATLKRCEYPLIAKCEFPGGSGTTTTPITTTPTTTTLNPIEPPCTSMDTEILPFPNDCTKYIYCLMGTPLVAQCRKDYYYSAANKACIAADKCPQQF